MNPKIIFLLFLIMFPVNAQYEKCEAEQSLTCIFTTALEQINELIAEFKQLDGYRVEDNGEHVRVKRDLVLNLGKLISTLVGKIISTVEGMSSAITKTITIMIFRITGLFFG